jgi:hypothetical protein
MSVLKNNEENKQKKNKKKKEKNKRDSEGRKRHLSFLQKKKTRTLYKREVEKVKLFIILT